MLSLLELDAEFADQSLLLAFEIRYDHSLTVHVFKTDIDKGDRAPDQIRVGCDQPLMFERKFGSHQCW